MPGANDDCRYIWLKMSASHAYLFNSSALITLGVLFDLIAAVIRNGPEFQAIEWQFIFFSGTEHM